MGALLSNEISHKILVSELVGGLPAGDPVKDYNAKYTVIALDPTPANIKVFTFHKGTWYDVTLVAAFVS